MHRIRLLFPWALGFVLGALLVTAASRDASHGRETARLHAHFARVLARLQTRDVSGWSATRQENRRHLLGLLADYDRTGRFPRNEGQLARRTPIFIDRHETRCAMAYLIENFGGAALVARVAATRNLAYLPELANDAELERWLAGSGLDLAEAALIQPQYDPAPPVPSPPPPRKDPTPSDAAMTAGVLVSAGLALPAIYMSLRPQSSVSSGSQARTFGVLAAAPAFVVGFADAIDDGHLRGSGIAQLAIGATSLTFALLHRAHTSRAPANGVPTAPAPRTAPVFRAGGTGEPQVGIAMTF